MLPELVFAELTGRTVSVISATIAMRVAPTMAPRWIARLGADCALERLTDVEDSRRVLLILAPPTSQRLRSYFEAIVRENGASS